MAILNIGMIGTGGRARSHLTTIPKMSDKYRLTSICDIEEERAKQVAQEMNVNGYTDLEEMLDKEKLDVVFIAVQAEGHHVIAKFLAERKIHIITETPIAITACCADVMIKAAKENGVLLEVSENVYRWPHERLKKKIVEAGLLGNLTKFYLSYTSGSYHGMSAIRAILQSEAERAIGEFPDDENVKERAQITFQNGIVGQYEYNRNRGNYWEIIGEKGALHGNELHLYNNDQKFQIMTETIGDGDRKTISKVRVETEPEVVWESHLQQYALPAPDDVSRADVLLSMYNAVVHDKELDYGGENGKRDVELLMALRDSASKGGAPVDLPLTGMTDHEKLIHSEFEKFYGSDLLRLSPEDMKIKYTLPEGLRGLMYYGKM